MSIRKRLASFIVLMMGFLVIMGGLLMLGSPIIVGAFRQSLDTMNSLNAVRELNFNINRQRSSLNRYLLLNDSQELIRFQESGRRSKENLQTLAVQYGTRPPDWFNKTRNLFDELHQGGMQVIENYKSGQRAKAQEDWLADLFPRYKTLSKDVTRIEQEEAQQVQSMFLRIRDLSQKVGMVVLVFFAIAILAGVFLFRSLYRAVMIPLEILKEGATKFGKGRFDHRIRLPSHNEFGSLGESFNTMAENVSQLQLQAVHMDRMSAVGQLAGGVAHEINNPLTAVLGQAQILLAKLDEKDPKVAQLKKIENAAIRCRKIVRGLLDFSRPSQTQFEPIDVNAMISSTLDLCEADVKKTKISLSKNLNLQIPPIRGNMSELQQVLLNLINNAIQAMPNGGTLSIETKTHNRKLKLKETRKGTPRLSAEGPWVEISVRDSGVGISDKHISRVFDPFFTTKDIGKGTGLGLSVSMGIIQKHGGDLSVESSGPNRGATFIVTLSVKGPASNVQGGHPKPGLAA